MPGAISEFMQGVRAAETANIDHQIFIFGRLKDAWGDINFGAMLFSPESTAPISPRPHGPPRSGPLFNSKLWLFLSASSLEVCYRVLTRTCQAR
jgi:hypothetical protein